LISCLTPEFHRGVIWFWKRWEIESENWYRNWEMRKRLGYEREKQKKE